MTDKFAPTARAMAELNGLPGYPFAVIPHPIANNDDAELRAKAEAAVRQCAAILTQRPAGDERPVHAPSGVKVGD